MVSRLPAETAPATWPEVAKGATLSGSVTVASAGGPPGRPMALARAAGPAAATANATATAVTDSAVAAMTPRGLFMVSLSSAKRGQRARQEGESRQTLSR